jgi:uncharacterized protein (TIGR03435 family)
MSRISRSYDVYDVMCKDTESGGAKELHIQRIRSGVQALLADRFGLQFHRDTRRFPAVTLAVGKSGLKATPSTAGNRGGGYGPLSIKAEGWTITDLANALTSLVGERIVDETGLAGRYDFDLKWSIENRTAETVPDGNTRPAILPDVAVLDDALSERLERPETGLSKIPTLRELRPFSDC